MKGSAHLIATVLAASTTVALSSSSSAGINYASVHPSSYDQGTIDDVSMNLTTSKQEKFMPRFDGLRFIETLITAHR